MMTTGPGSRPSHLIHHMCLYFHDTCKSLDLFSDRFVKLLFVWCAPASGPVTHAQMFPVEGSGILNDMFQELTVGWFPAPALGHVFELSASDSIAQAVATLVQHNLCV